MEISKKIAGVLVIIGGLNWGLVGINENWNLVELLLGSVSWLEKTVYILVGLSALLLIVGKGRCKSEPKEDMSESTPEMSQSDVTM